MKKVIIVIFAFSISLSYADDWQRLMPQSTSNTDTIFKVHFIDGLRGLIVVNRQESSSNLSGHGVHYTNDSGKTWTPMDNWPQSNWSRYYRINSICHSDVNTVWIAGGEDALNYGRNNYVYKSVDGGKKWEIAVSIDSLLGGVDADSRYTISHILFPTSSIGYFFMSASSFHIYPMIVGKTIDGGVNWNILNPIDGFSAIDVSFVNADTGWIVGQILNDVGFYDFGILKTEDGGLTLVDMRLRSREQFGDELSSVFFLNSEVGWVGGTSRFVASTSDGGSTWTSLHKNNNISGNNYFTRIHFINENIGWGYNHNSVAKGGGLFRTTDGGRSWNANTTWDGYSSTNEGMLRDMYFDSVNGWVAGSHKNTPYNYNSLYKTSNYGGLSDLVSIKPVSRQIQGAASFPRVSVKGRTLNISIPANTAYNIRLVDMRGRTSARFSASGSGSFSLSKLPSGRYIAEVKTAGTKTTTAIIVQR